MTRNLREAQIQDAIRLELGNPERYPEALLFRNNCGQMIDAHGKRVVFGLGKGSADLVGLWRHPDGRAQYVELEIKRDNGKQSPEQVLRQQLITSKGGVYAVLRSVDEARAWAAEMRSKP